MVRWSLVIVAVLIGHYSFPVIGEGTVTLKDRVAVSGSGCGSGTVAITFSADFSSLSVLFTDFRLMTGPTVGNIRAIKRCRIRIPLSVSAGYKVTVRSADYRGFVQLPSDSKASFYSRFSLKDSRRTRWSNRAVSNFVGPVSDELFSQPNTPVSSRSCGGYLELSMYLRGSVLNRNSSEDASLELDSLDFVTDPQIALHVSTQACN